MEKNNLYNKEILISGGSGSLGQTLTKLLLEKYKPKGIRIFSRGELLQWEMQNKFNQKYPNAPISYLIGDVRDKERLKLATKGVDIIVHCAALKQVPVGENNPLEVVNTNIIGSQNIIYSALENKVGKAMAISSDKAVLPINLYGAAKMVMEKLFIQGNVYAGGRYPKLSCCRYGNVLGSRGSVVPLFQKQYKETGEVTITDPKMTRFWITLNQVAEFVLKSIEEMTGGEIFIPKMPSAHITEILTAVIPGQHKIKYTGIRPGEKLHETLITKEESTRIKENDNRYIITTKEVLPAMEFEYRSDTNSKWLNYRDIRKMLEGG